MPVVRTGILGHPILNDGKRVVSLSLSMVLVMK